MTTSNVRLLLQLRNAAQMELKEAKGDEARYDRFTRKVNEYAHALARAGMHIVESREITPKDAMMRPPFGPGLSAEFAETARHLEVWGTKYNRPGPDFCMMCVQDSNGENITICKVDGY